MSSIPNSSSTTTLSSSNVVTLSVSAHVKVKAILVYAYLLLTNAYLITAVIGIASCRIFRIRLVTI